MQSYDLSRFSVLVVEDNKYITSLLVMCMRVLGVGTVKMATDGGQAIELLKLMKTDPVRAGMQNVDLVLSNWQMAPVDGLMFLRWIRRHKESPNRFVPFVMITGYADPEHVAAARDLGVTDMLAKPFSINSVADKLVTLIERPRQFIHTADYFGPDRRRRALPHAGEDRRKLDDKSPTVEVVYE
ncbi:response regulator [Oceanibacterium hippocampi]|uniref:Chemotaxis protein CheY n=1 Tax=Oceanibacterium hippocampi TaxID=745714 RepID=A0A1Y5SJ25_9PROT|nr:response regulator [Oceanibacterium hippocampi]SLN38780.1 Chemotaxis protein CheY [Oceanibacterium hippocampi]